MSRSLLGVFFSPTFHLWQNEALHLSFHKHFPDRLSVRSGRQQGLRHTPKSLMWILNGTEKPDLSVDRNVPAHLFAAPSVHELTDLYRINWPSMVRKPTDNINIKWGLVRTSWKQVTLDIHNMSRVKSTVDLDIENPYSKKKDLERMRKILQTKKIRKKTLRRTADLLCLTSAGDIDSKSDFINFIFCLTQSPRAPFQSALSLCQALISYIFYWVHEVLNQSNNLKLSNIII